jgi:hypothetical protein
MSARLRVREFLYVFVSVCWCVCFGVFVFLAYVGSTGWPVAFGHRSVVVLAAGVTWTSRTASAPWAGREGHTSVIDATGAIYVIGGRGGTDGTTYFNDVLVSTDGGADRSCAVTRGYSGRGVLGCNRWFR